MPDGLGVAGPAPSAEFRPVGVVGRRTPRHGVPVVAVVLLLLLVAPPTAAGTSRAAPPAPPLGAAVGPPLGNGPTPPAATAIPYTPSSQSFPVGAPLPSRVGFTGVRSPGGVGTVSTDLPARPLPSNTSGGTVTGRVLDRTTLKPVADASVTVSSLYGIGCVGCAGGTDALGDFSVSAPAGADVITVENSSYLTNTTWATVPANGTVSVGTVFLVHDAWATGIVESTVPGHPPIPQVDITVLSRDGSINLPILDDSANGTFRVLVPPLPSEIEFAYIPTGSNASPFLPNWTYTNATPYATLHLGAVYLDGGVSVHAEFYDRSDGTVIPATVPSQLVVCTYRGSTCLSPPVAAVDGGGNVTGWAVPGPAYVRALALGYVVNQTAVANIPNSNGSIDLGRIYLVPSGAVELSVNLTGGPPSSTGWANGTGVGISVCSLVGIQVAFAYANGTVYTGPCFGGGTDLGGTVVVPAPPLRDAVVLDSDAPPGFPVGILSIPNPPPSAAAGTWPVQESNITWANVTAGERLDLGSVNLTPGTYLAGNVSINGALANATTPFTVEACSLEEAGLCGKPVGATNEEPSEEGCPATWYTFCAPAPPGPDELKVTAIGTSLGSVATNQTWVIVPNGCCAQDGHPTWLGTVNVTLSARPGRVVGSVAIAAYPGARPHPAVGALLSVEACLVPTSPAPSGGTPPCSTGFTNASSATFNLTTYAGWNRVAIQGSGISANLTWLFVNGTNSTGPIVVDEDALVHGQVVDPSGRGVYAASLSWCPASEPELCTGTGGTLASTDGEFNLTVPGSRFPGDALEVYANASGFDANWTWVNASAGNVSQAGVIVLAPTVTGGAPLPRLAAGSPEWITGRFVDNRTGLGVPGETVTACPILGTSCAFVYPDAPTSGYFNFSLPRGIYDLTINTTDYAVTTRFVNATAGPVDLGVVRLDPFDWVRGRIAVAPWKGLVDATGLGADAVLVEACNGFTGACGASGVTATDGTYNVSAPPGIPVTFQVTGLALPSLGTEFGGYDPATFWVNVTEPYVALPSSTGAAVGLSLFGAVSGTLRDGRSWDPARGIATAPAGFATAAGTVDGQPLGAAEVPTGGGGAFTLFLAANGNATHVYGSGSAYLTANWTRSGSLGTGTETAVGDVVLTHYGFLEGAVEDAATSAPIGGAVIDTEYYDAANGTSLTTLGYSNGMGLFFTTAPPESSVNFSISALGYVNFSTTVPVVPGSTSSFGTVPLTEGGSTAAGWVQSAEVNTVGHPPTPTVVDGATQQPLANVGVVAISPNGSTPTISTNALGQFLTTALPGNPDSMVWSAPGYVTRSVGYDIPPASRTVVDRLNLTGDAILAGRVVAEPGGAGVGGVVVRGCAPTGLPCTAVAFTNAVGDFWISVAPGGVLLTVSVAGYLTNASLSRTVTTDSWNWVGLLPVYSFAEVSGTVRSLPSGLPLANASVSVCGTLLVPWGPCGATVPTNASGSFSIPYPPGRYDLVVSAPYYNTTMFPLALLPGARVAFGTIFLLQWGGLSGTVVSAVSGASVPAATVQACPDWAPTACTVAVPTNQTGAYLFLAPPGPVTLYATAPGYADGTLAVSVAPGEVTRAGPIALVPLAPEIPERLQGTVVANRTGVPLVGAFVALEQGGAPVAATSSGAGGAFTLVSFWGSYALVAEDPGFTPLRTSFVLHGNVSGERIALDPFAYLLTGTVTDAATGAPLAGVALELNGTVRSTTGPNGTYQLTLPNGTYQLTAAPFVGSAFLPVTFVVTISGASSVHDLLLAPANVVLTGAVVDAYSGLPVPGASVILGGAALPGSAHELTQAPSALGRFSFAVPPGRYTLTVTAPGYAAWSGPVDVSNQSPSLTVGLEPLGASGPAGTGGPILVLGLGGAAAAGLGLLLLLRRRRRRVVADAEVLVPYDVDGPR